MDLHYFQQKIKALKNLAMVYGIYLSPRVSKLWSPRLQNFTASRIIGVEQ